MMKISTGALTMVWHGSIATYCMVRNDGRNVEEVAFAIVPLISWGVDGDMEKTHLSIQFMLLTK